MNIYILETPTIGDCKKWIRKEGAWAVIGSRPRWARDRRIEAFFKQDIAIQLQLAGQRQFVRIDH